MPCRKVVYTVIYTFSVGCVDSMNCRYHCSEGIREHHGGFTQRLTHTMSMRQVPLLTARCPCGCHCDANVKYVGGICMCIASNIFNNQALRVDGVDLRGRCGQKPMGGEIGKKNRKSFQISQVLDF